MTPLLNAEKTPIKKETLSQTILTSTTLIKTCFIYVRKRMTATESLRHPWLRPRPPLPVPPPAPPVPSSGQQEEEESSSEPSPEPSPSPSPVPTPTAPQKQVAVQSEDAAATAAAVNNCSKDEPVKPAAPVAAINNSKSAALPAAKENVAGPIGIESKEILQVTKVNLRQFVERWNSHPNSPFQLNSDSPRRTISLLISPSQLDASPTSLTGMSPSPPCSIPTSPITRQAPLELQSEPDSTEIVCSGEKNHTGVSVAESMSSNTISRTTTTVQPKGPSSSVEAAIEQTSALLKSVKESLIRQIETGTAVRDRTGARVWERKGSGLIGSPGPAAQRRAPQVVSVPLDIVNKAPEPAKVGESQAKVGESQEAKPKEEAKESEPAKTSETSQTTVDSIEDWEVHPPVEARTYGFAKRHKTISSTVTVVKATEAIHGTTSSYSLSSSSVIEMESHQP